MFAGLRIAVTATSSVTYLARADLACLLSISHHGVPNPAGTHAQCSEWTHTSAEMVKEKVMLWRHRPLALWRQRPLMLWRQTLDAMEAETLDAMEAETLDAT